MMYVRFPLSLRNVEDLLFERGIDLCHETVRLWWNRFGPLFATDIRRQRVQRMRGFPHWRWHLDEMYVRLNGEMVYLWRAVDHEGEVLESYVTKKRDKAAALRFMKKTLKRHGQTAKMVLSEQHGSGRARMVTPVNASQIPRSSAQPVPTVQFITRGNPPRGHDVCEVSTIAAECRRPPVRTRYRSLS